MAVSPVPGFNVPSGVSYYRITSLGFRAATSRHHAVEFRLITPGRSHIIPFTRPATELLDFFAGEVRMIAPRTGPGIPARLSGCSTWTVVPFNH
jgi:hypothetical protein